jgi:hypothetical protein
MLPDREYRRFPVGARVGTSELALFCHEGTDSYVARRETRVVGTVFPMQISTVEKSTDVLMPLRHRARSFASQSNSP